MKETATAILTELKELGYTVTDDNLVAIGNQTHRIVDTENAATSEHGITIMSYGIPTIHGDDTTCTDLELADPEMIQKLLNVLEPPK